MDKSKSKDASKAMDAKASKGEKSKMTQGEAMNHLLEMISDVKMSMMTTQDKDGNLRSRPMQTVESSPDGTFWFFTSDHSSKANEVVEDPRVNLSYAVPEKNRYVSVSGIADIVHDMAKKKELWKTAFKAWFPEGVEDPHCALMKVYVEKAEYWDTPSSTFVEIVGFTKAVLTGETYQADKDSHQKINFGESTGASK